MRKILLAIVAVVAIILSASSIRSSVLRLIPCREPITYKIGTIDPRFGVSRDQFIKDINQASGIWGSAIGKTLFKYDPNGRLTVNLIYDDRQKITQQEQKLTSDINSTSQVADSVKREYQSLYQNYLSLRKAYDIAVAKFDQEEATYESQVTSWNNRGGAPRKEYQALVDEKNNLVSEQSALEAQRQQVNSAASEVNDLIDKYNLLVNRINTNVNAINNDGLTGTQFEEGVYISDSSGERINIYQFDNQTFFIRVLAHELGHALGLEHDSGQDSIMNPINSSQNLKLTAEDLSELKAECKISTSLSS